MYSASEGDALVLSWGTESTDHHALVDLGRNADYKAIRPALQKIRRFELFTITHIDADHIAGAMPLVKENSAPFAPADVWFNAWHHLKNADSRLHHVPGLETLSVKQGEKLSAGILRFGWPWNRAFGFDGIASVDSPSTNSPIELDGNLKITLLSPGDQELAALLPVWMKELTKANLRPMDPDEAATGKAPPGFEILSPLNVEALAAVPFLEDKSEPNGASIAFLGEFGTRRVLLGADAHPSVIERALRKLGFSEKNPLKLDLFKLCHHGSKANTSPALLRILDCTRFAISTDGTKHNHPDRETIARILVNDPKRPKTLYFNVNQEQATVWEQSDLQKKYGFKCVIPPKETPGLTIEI
jgi:beta-lactamase superfamily II metal-dependent hydrolase